MHSLVLRKEIDFEIKQRFSIHQLGEVLGTALIKAGEVLDFELAPVANHEAEKSAHQQMLHELGEHTHALLCFGEKSENDQSRELTIRHSNRAQMKMLKMTHKSLAYDHLV